MVDAAARPRRRKEAGLETDQWLRGYEAKVAELRQKSEDLQEDLASAAATATSRDGTVTVTVGPNGGLRDLRLGHRAVDLGAARLTELILHTVRTAQHQVAAKVREAFEPLGGGTEAMEMYLDAVPDNPEPQPEPVAEPVADRSPVAPPTPPTPVEPSEEDEENEEGERPW